MNKRKETAAKILTLLDGLSYSEAYYILEEVKADLGNASFVSMQIRDDRQKSTVPTDFKVVYDFTTANQ